MKSFLLFLGSIAILTSCVKNNPDAVWLEVNSWQLETNGIGSPEGELTENISDAWVYIDDQLVGVFEVPFKIPLLVSGNNKKITMYPTIRNNGISATKKIYPFLEPYITTVNLIQNDTLTITPITRYYSTVLFTILDFEDGTNLGFEESPYSLAAITASSDPTIIQPFNGTQFGRVTLTEADNLWKAATNLDQQLPQSGAEVYLEVDYHSTVDVVTGVVAVDLGSGSTTANVNVQFNGQDPDSVTVEWKKIYIDLKTIVSGSIGADYFEHSFESMLPEGETSGVINIDNVKVVHF